MKKVRCQSGIMGYECHLQESYDNYQQFKHFSQKYNLHNRLGFRSIIIAWETNPVIQGSVIPSDFKVVSI